MANNEILRTDNQNLITLAASASYATTASSVPAIAGSNVGAASYSGSFSGSALYTGKETNVFSGTGAIAVTSGSVAFTISGSAPRLGTTILVSGVKKVSTTAITATSRVFLSTRTDGGTIGNLSYSASIADGFTINSSNILDVSTIDWFIVDGF